MNAGLARTETQPIFQVQRNSLWRHCAAQPQYAVGKTGACAV